MDKSKIIRIFLTALVLLVGGYYIQQSTGNIIKNNDGAIISAQADAPPTK